MAVIMRQQVIWRQLGAVQGGMVCRQSAQIRNLHWNIQQAVHGRIVAFKLRTYHGVGVVVGAAIDQSGSRFVVVLVVEAVRKR